MGRWGGVETIAEMVQRGFPDLKWVVSVVEGHFQPS